MSRALRCLVGLTILPLLTVCAADKPTKPTKPDAATSPTMVDKTPKPTSTPGVDKSTLSLVSDTTPARDPKPLATEIDRWVAAGLTKAKLSAAPVIADGEFLRRTALHLIGRVPTEEELDSFLASTEPDKRQRWVNDLLASPAYGEHFATIWHELMVPVDNALKKSARDPFTPWLAVQFNANRGWDAIVRDMLTAEGRMREVPAAGFILANSESSEPLPNLLADATARLFWGVQLRCAECHDHPYAPWKQADFWGVAAFFGRLHKGYLEGKNPVGWTLTEAIEEVPSGMGKVPGSEMRPPLDAGAAVRVPETGRKMAGQLVQARFLGGATPAWKDPGPYRPRFAEWATGAEHPWFARNAVNRLWSHFFTRGLVMPLDGQHESAEASHPELLAALTREFSASGFNVKQLIRSICASQAYQRSSRPAPGTELDETLFSHHRPRVMRAEVLYDSLSVVLQPPFRKGGGKLGAKVELARAQPISGMSRDEFVRAFATRPDENHGSTVNEGIPQLLELMNGRLLADLQAAAGRVTKAGAAQEEIIARVYRLAYTRTPSAEEQAWVKDYFASHTNPNDGCAGLLWTLLNSGEFLTNH